MTPNSAIVLVWVGWWLSWIVAARWSAPSEARAGMLAQITNQVPTIIGTVLLFVRVDAWVLDRALWPVSRVGAWAAVACTAVGFAFCWWARVHIGRLWSRNVARKADHHIVDTGPYGMVRHPIYTGISLAGLATAAERATPLALAGAALMIAGWFLKARLEERFLRAELGAEAYDAYARRVPMLIPFLS
jgi:protein-S-isoprenylcysteine O-methyltransferase Ste14